MPSKDYNSGEGFIEWFTVSYRTLKFWGLMLLLASLAAGAFYAFRYLARSVETREQELRTRESRPARFVEIQGDVRIKQVNQTNWISAQRVKVLNMGDVISTGPRANCKIIYFDGTYAVVNENTLYVVSESYMNPATEAHTIKGEITTGEVRMSTPERKNKDTSVKLATEEAEAALASSTDATGRRNKDAGESEFYVWGGKAEVFSKKDKKTVLLNPNEQVAVSGRLGMNPVRQMPPSPEIIQPEDAESLLLEKLPAQVDLRWKPVAGIKQYRLRVSDQPTFLRPRYNLVLQDTKFRLTNLTPGTYYWQIFSIDDKGVESASPRSSKFFISSAKTKGYGNPIRLEVEKVVQMGEIFELVGRTEPGVRLTVNGKNVDIRADGQFKVFTDPVGNATSLVVVARDITGNIISKTLPIK
ncbi:MAG: hypothetical protein HY644_10830 [Acidobacteria bacterium]|nr:hypothetical protein [Acidobacteriota bacterium]